MCKLVGCFLSAILLSIIFAQPVAAEFRGRIILIPDGCRETRDCRLAEDFGFTDQNNVSWQADEGDLMNGADIPWWAQPAIGGPYTEAYLPAAVLHDHYSKSQRNVRPWLATQRMFHEVLLFSGVPPTRAAIMYAAVLLGSGKWVEPEEGKPCRLYPDQYCINAFGLGPSLLTEAESFTTARFEEDFMNMRDVIQRDALITREQVEALALGVRPFDIYLNNPDGVIGERDTGVTQ